MKSQKSTNNKFTKIESSEVSDIVWYPSSDKLLVIEKFGFKVYSDKLTLIAHPCQDKEISCVAWSPDGEQLFTACMNGEILVWDRNYKLQYSYQEKQTPISSLALSDVLIIVYADSSITLRNLKKQENIKDFKIFDNNNDLPLFLSPSGNFLALWDSKDSKIQIWELINARLLSSIPANEGNYLWWNTTEEKLANSMDANGRSSVWNPKSGKLIETFSIEGFPTMWSPDERYLLGYWHEDIRIWDTANYKIVGGFDGHMQNVFLLKWSPNGGKIASFGEDTQLFIWEPLIL